MAKAPAEESKTAAKADKAKQPKAKASKPAKPGMFARLGQYFRDVRSEMRRVVWPSSAEVKSSTWVVAITLLFFVAFAVLVDTVVQFLLFDVIAKLGG